MSVRLSGDGSSTEQSRQFGKAQVAPFPPRSVRPIPILWSALPAPGPVLPVEGMESCVGGDADGEQAVAHSPLGPLTPARCLPEGPAAAAYRHSALANERFSTRGRAYAAPPAHKEDAILLPLIHTLGNPWPLCLGAESASSFRNLLQLVLSAAWHPAHMWQ